MRLEDIYNLIPDFKCIDGCTECCRKFGVPSMKQIERRRILSFTKKHNIKTDKKRELTCPYLEEGKGCRIYPVRPLICRLYGTSPSYMCIKGIMPLRMLHQDEEDEIFHLYMSTFK